MSVTIKQDILVTRQYGSLGSVEDTDTTSIEVVYTVSRLVDFDGTNAVAEFSISIGGSDTGGTYLLMYVYSGTGNPLDEAESSLSTKLGG